MMKRLIALTAVCAAVLGVAPVSSRAIDIKACHSTNPSGSACEGYQKNGLKALVLYYRWAHSANAEHVRQAQKALASVWIGQAAQAIKARVADWPTGEYDVASASVFSFHIVPDRPLTAARLISFENWDIRTVTGRQYLLLQNFTFNITMKKVAGHWFITSYQVDKT